MFRKTAAPFLTVLLLHAGTMCPCRGQEDSTPEPSPPRTKDQDVVSLYEMHDKFQKMGGAPLKIGDTGVRVRELQATLNKHLSGRVIELRYPILVSPALGPGPSPRDRQRLAYSKRRDIAFQIRGDWEPVDDLAGSPHPDEDKPEFRTHFLKFPEEPLKVDGIFGQHTKAGVAFFQHYQFLPVSGEVDAVTLDKLEPLSPTNPILAFVMNRVESIFDERNDYYPYLVKNVTSVVVTLLILVAAMIVYQFTKSLANSTHFLSKWLFTPESSPWFTALYRNKFFRRAAHIGPALFIFLAGLLVFPAARESNNVFPYIDTFQDWNGIVSHLGLAYISLVLMLIGFAGTNTVDSVINPDQETDNPIGSIIRAAKRIIGFLGILLIIASLAGKSPFLIVGGLGAFMAIFLLVFKEPLLGLVASAQIISNKVVRIGDWISMPSYHADGEVQKISLTLIKVQNGDKTISTIPTKAVLTEPFQNWTGVEVLGGRRIKRSLLIDMRSIKVCSEEMIGRFEKIELLQSYIANKRKQLAEYNKSHRVEASAVNSRRLTNIGTLRAYLDGYLKNHPGLKPDMTMLVRHLQPTSTGLPLEIYAFCNTTEWPVYEAIQADIFDHILAILPEFELRTFQEITELQPAPSREESPDPEVLAGVAEIERLVAQGNAELAENPRTRPATRLKSIRKKIRELGLGEVLEIGCKDRSLEIHLLPDR